MYHRGLAARPFIAAVNLATMPMMSASMSATVVPEIGLVFAASAHEKIPFGEAPMPGPRKNAKVSASETAATRSPLMIASAEGLDARTSSLDMTVMARSLCAVSRRWPKTASCAKSSSFSPKYCAATPDTCVGKLMVMLVIVTERA